MIMRMAELDTIDRHMIRLLQQDGRMSNAELADRVGLSASACLRRLRQLESDGVIRGYTAIIAEEAAEAPMTVMVEIVLERQTADHMNRFETAVRRLPEVRECYLMSGSFDYLLRIESRDAADYERIHRELLARLPAVSRIKSSFTMRAITQPTSRAASRRR
jgi:DNA-binding Lrp family transcriptional regulator